MSDIYEYTIGMTVYSNAKTFSHIEFQDAMHDLLDDTVPSRLPHLRQAVRAKGYWFLIDGDFDRVTPPASYRRITNSGGYQQKVDGHGFTLRVWSTLPLDTFAEEPLVDVISDVLERKMLHTLPRAGFKGANRGLGYWFSFVGDWQESPTA